MPVIQGDGGATASGDGLISILRRRWWVIALCAALFPAAAYLISSQQPKVYSSKSVVLLNQTNLANSLTDTPDPSLRVDRDRQAKTQVEVAQLPEISERTIKNLKITNLRPSELADSVTVTSETGTDILTIEVQGGDPDQVEKLAAEYAHQYTGIRARLDTKALAGTLAEVRRRLRQPHLGSDLRDSLQSKEAQLSTLQTLQTRNSLVIRGSSPAEQIEPNPKRAAALALLLGLMAGCTLALILDARDRRIRDARQIAGALGTPLIGRVPPVSNGATRSIAMLTDPRGPEADAYRFVLSGLDPVTAESARSMLVVSASDGEGRSRTVANLAVAFARAGEHVLAVDLDFESGRLSSLFGIADGPGASEIAAASAPWEAAARSVAIAPPQSQNGRGPSSAGFGLGTLTVLPTGTVPASAADFVGSRPISEMLERFESTFDRVLIDAPGLLGASDSLLLSRSVDAVLVVASAKRLNRDAVEECKRLLDRVPAPIIGVVSTDDTTPAKLLARGSRGASRGSGHPAGVAVG